MLYISSSLAVSDVSAASFSCTNLTASLGLSLVQTSGTEYTATAQGTWSLFNSLDTPTCIVYPQSTADVQTIMTAIYHTQSKYAVLAGGHSGMVGYNSISAGVLISFEQMTNVSYDASSDTVTVQPGVHWADAMTYLEPYGISVLGGRAGDIGTGLLLGGGISFLSPQYGWSSDSIKSADVVLVSGKMVTANAANAHKDLFQALKGGANRFGIYPGSQSVAVSNASAAYIRENTDPKATLMVLMNTMDLTSADANIVYMYYQGTELPESIFGTFLSIPNTLQSFSNVSYYEMGTQIAGNARGNGQQFGASAFVGDEETFLDGFNHLVNFTANFKDQLDSSYMIISPVPRSQWAVTKERGGNAIGDPGVAYAAMNFEPIYPAGVTAIPADVSAGFDLLLSQVPPSPGLPLYINECDVSQKVYKTYPNYASLKKTYAKYDPTRFNMGHTVGPMGL
ncbi:FAD-binding domain-containing protein [Mycena sp. CBHHK59/15]|nr:FAD-binding domain-containing protein [Mycena sp. CBHHK59/15]